MPKSIRTIEQLKKELHKRRKFDAMQEEEADEFQKRNRPGKVGKGAGKTDKIKTIADLRKRAREILDNPLTQHRIDRGVFMDKFFGKQEKLERGKKDMKRSKDPAIRKPKD